VSFLIDSPRPGGGRGECWQRGKGGKRGEKKKRGSLSTFRPSLRGGGGGRKKKKGEQKKEGRFGISMVFFHPMDTRKGKKKFRGEKRVRDRKKT